MESLHNIQADSDADGSIVVGGEDAGYGHVGADNPGDGSDYGFWPVESHEAIPSPSLAAAVRGREVHNRVQGHSSQIGSLEKDPLDNKTLILKDFKDKLIPYEEPAKTCSKCGGRVLSAQQHVELNQVMDADHKFDAGEWSSSQDYYKGICRCDEEEGE